MNEYDYRVCPLCGGKNTYQRMSQMNGHLRSCSDCNKDYDPYDEEQKHRLAEQERLSFNTNKDY